VVVVEGVEEEELLPPQPAIGRLRARTARSVSMPVSGVLFMVGRSLLVSRFLGRPPYQPCL